MKLVTSGIDHLNLEVRNLDECCRFWNELLGFEVLEDIPEQRGRIIGTDRAKLALYENPDLDPEGMTGFAHVSFHVKNFDHIQPLCEKLGLSVKYDGPVQWPGSRSIYIEDPNGYEVELSEVWGGGL